MTYFEIAHLACGATWIFERLEPKEKVIVVAGQCCIRLPAMEIEGKVGTDLDIPSSEDRYEVCGVTAPVTAVRMCGHWGDVVGGSGVFSVVNAELAHDQGDEVGYAKTTSFDNHFHDCDEYWIAYQGSCEAVSEGIQYLLKPGDWLVTGMGYHHDVARVVDEPFRGVYFETTLEGAHRPGHLWEHTHGKAQPQTERV